ncbi:hypothetical protein [Streptomyces sp. NPDC058751]|uniref:hypothetical protein n=1 Tax=Streptomyces sp. NPDC058751 TaxID=3346623 RepID=UPI00368B97EA
MAKRPGAVVLAAGALLALCCPGAVAAQTADEGRPPAREVSGGHMEWSSAESALAGRGVSLGVAAPAVREAADRAWFPALGGSAGTGSAEPGLELELGGAARLGGPAGRPLVLGGLRLELDDGEGTLYVRTVVDGRADELALAEIVVPGAGPVVRADGVTWTGLRALLTEKGAALLSAWGTTRFEAGEELGALDVTASTASAAQDGRDPATPVTGPSPSAVPAPSAGPSESGRFPESGRREGPVAAVGRPALAAGGEQTVTGAGFAPGAVVLVAIDGDTRYQAVADAEGRLARAFPVYAGAVEGSHTVVLTAVGGERGAVGVGFEVETPN